MPWAPRPDPSQITGNLDTTETAGVTASQGDIRQISGVFAVAADIDRARVGSEGQAGQAPEQLAAALGSSPLPSHLPGRADPQRVGWEALVAAQSAEARLRAQGFEIDKHTGQVVRLAPPPPTGGGMGTMITVDEGTQA
jgi:hypothetical protein